MVEILLAGACVLYALEYSFFLFGMRRVRRYVRLVPASYPHVSVLVAARNEARNIEHCLKALVAQDYPHDRMEILAIDDESTDNTGALIREVAAANPGRIRPITTSPEATHARGKARAIAQGMDVAEGEIILLTDADCVPPKTWARAVVEYFTPGVDACGGFTLVRSRDFFSAVQQLDWLHLHTLAAAGLAFDIPLGIIGNNFAFRRGAYEAVGGYRAVKFTVTEDYALFCAMHRRGFRIIFPCSRDAAMVTHPCESLADVLRQKQRWSRGGIETGIRGYMILVIAVLMMISLVVAPFISPLWWALVWGTKFIFDLAVMIPTLRALGRIGQLRYFLLFEFYFIAQALVVPILLMNPTVVWKGRSYRS